MIWPIVSSRYAVDAPTSEDLFSDIISQITSNTGAISSVNQLGNSISIGNGSFEDDANLVVQPESWNFTGLTGGSGLVTTTDSYHGARSYRVTHPGGAGKGGGMLDTGVMGTSGFIPVCIGQSLEMWFGMKSSVSNVRVMVDAYWYDNNQSLIGSAVNIFDTTGISTTWRTYVAGCDPVMTPTAARFVQFRFTLGATTVDPGSVAYIYLDGVTCASRRPFSHIWVSGPGSGTFLVPAGVTKIHVRAIGAGGGGGTGAFGGAGGFVDGMNVVYPGQSITYSVGAGGIYSSAPPTSGGDTTFNGIIAGGGKRAGGIDSSVANGVGGSASGGEICIGGDSGATGYNVLYGFGSYGKGGNSGSVGSSGMGGLLILEY